MEICVQHCVALLVWMVVVLCWCDVDVVGVLVRVVGVGVDAFVGVGVARLTLRSAVGVDVGCVGVFFVL